MTNWRTSLASIVTAIGLIPTAIASLNLTTIPEWLMTVSYISVFIGIVASGLLAKDKNVTGVGENAVTKAEIEKMNE